MKRKYISNMPIEGSLNITYVRMADYILFIVVLGD